MIKVDIKKVNTNERYRKVLALIKWRAIVQNNGATIGLVRNNFYYEFEKLYSHCSYCEVYDKNPTYCAGCPLEIKGNSCMRLCHPYFIWFCHPTRKNAQAVLDLIKSVKVPSRGQ
jgi:hypothetical protein